MIYAPPPEKNGALRLLGLNFNSLQVGNENQVSKAVLASCRKPSHRRRIPPAGVDLLLSYTPLTGVEKGNMNIPKLLLGRLNMIRANTLAQQRRG